MDQSLDLGRISGRRWSSAPLVVLILWLVTNHFLCCTCQQSAKSIASSSTRSTGQNLAYTQQTGCDLLLASNDKLAQYCQCKDFELEDGNRSSTLGEPPNGQLLGQQWQVNQLSCEPENFGQILDDLGQINAKNPTTSIQITYLNVHANIAPNPSKNRPPVGGGTSQRQVKRLHIDHISLQIYNSHLVDGQPVESRMVEEQMVDLSRLINETHLQFLSIFLEHKINESPTLEKFSSFAPKRGDSVGEINFRRMLDKFTNLNRFELSLYKSAAFVFGPPTLSLKTKLKWLSLNGRLKFDLYEGSSMGQPGSSLEYLSLESCELESFPLYSLFLVPFEMNSTKTSAQYYGLANLTTLNLANNKLASFQRHLFAQFPHETHLSIGTVCSNPAELGPNPKVFLLPALAQLDLSHNKLTDLTLEIAQLLLCTMPNLSQLYLQHNRLVHLNLNSLLVFPSPVPQSVLEDSERELRPKTKADSVYSRLEFIDLSHNSLVKLTVFQLEPATFKSHRVKSINLGFNSLTRPVDMIDSRLVNRLIFKESFELDGQESFDKLQNLDTKYLNLYHIDSSFVISFGNESALTLCDYLSPPASSSSQPELLNEVILTNNQLGWISSSDFRSNQCESLQILNLSKNRISFIDLEAFWSLSSIEHLDLASNMLTILDAAVFSKNSKLRILSLSGNKLAALPRDIFINLSELEQLMLDHNLLKSISSDIFAHNIRLNVLDLSDNLLDNIADSSLANLKQLRILNLGANQLRKFSHHHFKLLNLLDFTWKEKITFQKPKTSYETTKRPKNAKKMAKSTNRLQKRQIIEDNSALVLSSNRLESIEIEDCAHFGNNVQFLWLNQNRLIELNVRHLKCMRSVRYLYLSSNRIKNLDQGALSSMNQLEYIDLSRNQLTHLKPGSLAHSYVLNHVYLDKNLFGTLKLTEVFMSNKTGSNIDPTPIETLSLAGNQNLKLDSLDLCTFIETVALRRVDLSNLMQIEHNGSTRGTKRSKRIHLGMVNLSRTKDVDGSLLSLLLDPLVVIDTIDLSYIGPSWREKVSPLVNEKLRGGLFELKLSGNQYNVGQVLAMFENLNDQLQLTSLDLASNWLDSWPFDGKIVQRLTNLRRLDISDNMLRYFMRENSTSYEFSQLEVLNLSSNAIFTLTEYPMTRVDGLKRIMPRLEQLDLSHNRLSWIPKQFLDGLARLSFLDVSHNKLETLPPLSPYRRLVLDLSFNPKLNAIEAQNTEWAGDMGERFDGLVVFDDHIDRLPRFKCMPVHEYVCLQNGCSGSRQDVELSEPFNYFQGSSQVDNQDELSDYAEHCKLLTGLTDSVKLVIEARDLKLSTLKWTTTRLLHLSFRNSTLRHLNTRSDISANIVQLDLSLNRFRDLQSNMCLNLSSLRSLDLSYNQLKEIELNSRACKDLNYLDVSSNELSSLRVDPNSAGQSSLIILILRNNMLNHLNDLRLIEFKSLRLIDLRWNQFKIDQIIPQLSSPLLTVKMAGSLALWPANSKLHLRASEDSLSIDWSPFVGEKSTVISQLGQESNYTVTTSTTNSQCIKFCSLSYRNLTKFCFRPKLAIPGDRCIYIRLPSNVRPCLTKLHEDTASTDVVTIDSVRKALGITRDQDAIVSRAGHDKGTSFFRWLERKWSEYEMFNISLYLANFGYNPEEFSWLSSIDDRYSTIAKLVFVVGSVCVVTLLILMFTMLTCVSGDPNHLSPESESITLTTSGSDQSYPSHCNRSSLSDDLPPGTQSEVTLMDLSSLKIKFSHANQQQSDPYHKDENQRQLDVSQLCNPQLCSTPSSSLAPSSVETAETMHAVDSIHSGPPSANQCAPNPEPTEGSFDIYSHDHISNQQYKPGSSVARIVKSNSAHFESPKTWMNSLNQYGTLNSRQANNWPSLGLKNHQNSYQKFTRNCQQTNNLFNGESNYGQELGSSGEEHDPVTMSLISINTALPSFGHTMFGSQNLLDQRDETNPSEKGHSSFCRLHHQIEGQSQGFLPYVILEQDEDQHNDSIQAQGHNR